MNHHHGRTIRRGLLAAVGLALASGACGMSARAEVVRYPEADYPISTAVEVPAGYSTVYISGLGPPVRDSHAPARTPAAYGDMEDQSTAAFQRVKDALGKMGLGMADVVQMHLYMVADPATKKLDFEGMMHGYRRFFGSADQPNVPARSAFAVAQLANPGWLIEVEVVAVRAPKK
ncbi:RidA family protein [Acetobacter conturbans]|uniref:Uncharacterized protein n=1 Tax=Acetobacter conturbans TaxID=1737472 RepID=A0ABX0K0P8_9PROT|nr:RidA family protein [Acetobacter conturbans]NHN88722.1 hypothetical protein [Acetobacter conturbans]